MSFFDEVDEPPGREARPRVQTRRHPPRGRGGRRPPRRPPVDRQAVQLRRAVALGVLLVVIVLIALGVHSCQVSADNSAMQTYANQAANLIQESNANGQALFRALDAAAGAGPTATQNAVNAAGAQARSLYHQAQQLGAPGQLASAQSKLALTLRMRADGIDAIAAQIQPALSGNQSALDTVILQMARFYASDVLYKDYAAPEVYAAMSAAGVRFAGLPAGQFLPSLDWLLPADVARALHVRIAGSRSKAIAPGLHGHQLNSVSVGATTLTPGGATNTVASATPTFTLHFANTGTNPETGVVCRVTVNGTGVSGTATVPQTEPGHSYTCNVTLDAAVPAGTQTVVAQIEKVPGETNLANNSLSYTVTFP